MVIKAILGTMTAIISFIGVGIGFLFTYIPWIERDDGSYSSINEANNLCQNDIVALFASQECAEIESMWLAGNGCCGLSLIVLILSLLVIIIPSGRKETIIVSNKPDVSQMWIANCPECGAQNVGNMEQMQGQIMCGGCGVLHSAVSLKKYA